MTYSLVAVQVEELSFAINPDVLRQKDAKIEIRPEYMGNVLRDPNNEKIWVGQLMVRVVSKEGALSPYNLRIRMTGVFQAEDLQDEADRRDLAYNMMEVILPYLRSAATTLTANAFVRPLMLPVVPVEKLFPAEAVFTERGVMVPKKEEPAAQPTEKLS